MIYSGVQIHEASFPYLNRKMHCIIMPQIQENI